LVITADPAAIARRLSLRDVVMGWMFLLLGLALLLMLVFGRISFWPGGCLGIVLFVLGLGWLSDDSSSKGKSTVAASARPALTGGSSTVVLTHTGEQKIQVIKVVREYTHLGLAAAKELVESAPQTILSNVSEQTAQQLRADLERHGARAQVS
jgi:large subunit ribosomal protein L7/L12